MTGLASEMRKGDGPLTGIRVLEIASMAPGPFACLLLAQLGAVVTRVDRPGNGLQDPSDLLGRGRHSVEVDLKHPDGPEQILDLASMSEVMVEGFRPGVAERLGIGPDVMCARNPSLVYGRMTGWGQHGRRRRTAGHDINYIALSGALHAIGPANRPPVPPLNLLGDFGGGGLLLAFGILAALHERSRTGRGQVVDAAMVDGAALLTTHLHQLRAQGMWDGPRGENLLDGGAPFYTTYETAGGGFVAVGAIEQPFYNTLVSGLGLDKATLPDRDDRTTWPALREILATRFRCHTRDHWDDLFAETDACVTPVLSPEEAPSYADNVERGVFHRSRSIDVPAAAPRLSPSPRHAEEATP